MKPNYSRNLSIVANNSLSNNQKISQLIEANPSPIILDDGQDPAGYFQDVMDRALKLGKSPRHGRQDIVAQSTNDGNNPFTFETPIVKTRPIPELGEYSLRLFMYTPNTINYSPSILATWHTAGRLSLREYISLKMFDNDNISFYPEAWGVLGLVGQSVEAFEKLTKRQKPATQSEFI